MRTPAGGRVAGLDVWRVILMLFGVGYHGVMLRPENAFFHTVLLASNSMRMGLFFALSGLVTAMALERYSPDRWLRRRLIGIGAPALFGLAVICPLTALASKLAPIPDVMPTGFPQWYHVWFLMALLIYTPVGLSLHRADERHGIVAAMEADLRLQRHAPTMLLCLVPLVSAALMELVMVPVAEFAPAPLMFPLAQLRPIGGYLPVFLVGMLMGRSAILRDAATRNLVLPCLALAATALAYFAWFVLLKEQVRPADRGELEAILLTGGSALCPPAMLILMVRSAMLVSRVPLPVRRLSEASFTIYLAHFPIVIALNSLFLHVAWNEYAEWVVAVLATLWLSYGLHIHLVCRSSLAALLFTGKMPSTALPTATPASAA